LEIGKGVIPQTLLTYCCHSSFVTLFHQILNKKNMEQTTLMTPEQLLEHWQGHRRLTRKTIKAFPETAFFEYSIGGMRPFAKLVSEIIDLAEYGIEGVVSGTWKPIYELPHNGNNQLPLDTQEEFLHKWDEVTELINDSWNKISPDRFQIVEKAFGAFEDTNFSSIMYFIDNEIHHRGQGTVYLRSLGIEPPAFYDRS
jgi:uncharacterized damage-inducible protein DinB